MSDPSKELRLLLAFFGDANLPRCEQCEAPAVPEPFRSLLVHEEHMTVKLESHYNTKVRVHPYLVHQQGEIYGRKLDLIAESTGLMVMTGLMLFNFSFCNDHVRRLIVEQKTPLGRILIENNILRRISAHRFLKFASNEPMVERFGVSTPKPAYGRLATILCDEMPAVDLLEIVRPEA